MLKIYSLYKQATVGDCTTPAPGECAASALPRPLP
jgi:acyl-CoA-binding protein